MKKGPMKRRKSRRRQFRSGADPGYYTKAGPVTITKSDGTVEVQPALNEREFQQLVRVRRAIDPALRQRIIRRDGKCRYCHTTCGPWEIDHKIPIALGGSNRMSNLVLACAECNRKKGASIW